MAESVERSQAQLERGSFRQYAVLGLVATSISVSGMFVDDTGLEQAVAAIPPHCIEDVQREISDDDPTVIYGADRQFRERRSDDKTVVDRVAENGFIDHFVELIPRFVEMMNLPHKQQTVLEETELVVDLYSNSDNALVTERFEEALMMPLMDDDGLSEPLSQHKIDCHRKSLFDEKRHSGQIINIRLLESSDAESVTGFVAPPLRLIPGLSEPTLFIITPDVDNVSFRFLAHELAHITEVIEGNRYLTRIKETENWANEVQSVVSSNVSGTSLLSE